MLSSKPILLERGETNEQFPTAALAVAGDVGTEAVVAFDLIPQIAFYDESPGLRRQALHQLVETDVPTAIAAETLRTAIRDEDQ